MATHGRGLYIADISPLAEVNLETLGQRSYFFQPESKVRWIGADMMNTASDNFDGESEAAEIPFYYWLQSGAGAAVTFTVYQGKVAVATVEGPGRSGSPQGVLGHEQASGPERRQQAARPGAQGFRGGSRNPPAPIGEYTVVMSVDGREMTRKVSILKDEWWMNRR